MDRNFSRSLAAVLEHEGGFVNHPKDPGGPTNLGITLENFRRYVKPDGTVEDLKALTREQAGIVYRRQYWDAVMASDLPDGLDLATFDFAVHSGPSRAAKLLQRAAEVADDGRIGPMTLAAVKAIDKATLITQLCQDRLDFLKRLPTWSTFGRGWERRVDEVTRLALELAAQPVDAPRVEVQQVEVPVAVTPPPPKRKWIWPVGGIGILSPVASAFWAADLPTKLIFAGLGIAATVFFLFLGEQIIRRIKKLGEEIAS